MAGLGPPQLFESSSALYACLPSPSAPPPLARLPSGFRPFPALIPPVPLLLVLLSQNPRILHLHRFHRRSPHHASPSFIRFRPVVVNRPFPPPHHRAPLSSPHSTSHPVAPASSGSTARSVSILSYLSLRPRRFAEKAASAVLPAVASPSSPGSHTRRSCTLPLSSLAVFVVRLPVTLGLCLARPERLCGHAENPPSGRFVLVAFPVAASFFVQSPCSNRRAPVLRWLYTLSDACLGQRLPSLVLPARSASPRASSLSLGYIRLGWGDGGQCRSCLVLSDPDKRDRPRRANACFESRRSLAKRGGGGRVRHAAAAGGSCSRICGRLTRAIRRSMRPEPAVWRTLAPGRRSAR